MCLEKQVLMFSCFNDPGTGKFSIRMSIEDAKELASMFRVVPNLEKQAKEKVVKAETILK